MLQGGLPIARLFGIEVRVSILWVFVLGLVTLLVADRVTGRPTGLPAGVEWLVGGAAAAVFLASMAAHELTHAFAERRHGLDPEAVSLGFVIGLAPLEVRGRTPREEIAIAVAGPAVSLGTAAVTTPAGILLEGAAAPVAAAGAALVVIGGLNGIVGLLSLLPGLPLDGGRVVRAVAWARTGDRRLAARSTARVGRIVGWILAGAGIVVALWLRPAEGLMILSLGWFLTTGARTVARRIAMEELLAGVPVRDALEREVMHIAPQLTLDTFGDRLMGTDGPVSLPVVRDARVVGIVGRDRLQRIGRRAWATTHAGEVMATPPDAPFLAADAPLWEAIDALQRSGLDGLAVTDAGELVGVLTRRGAAELIQARIRARAGEASR